MTPASLMSVTLRSALLCIWCLACLVRTAHSQVKLADPFGDHMVLPSDAPVAIWGTGCPGGDTLKLSIAGQSVITRCDWQGRWMVRLAPMKAGGPFQMLIQIGGSGPLVSSSAANDHGGAEINDVLIGKVVVMRADASPRPMPSPETGRVGEHPFAQVRVLRQGETFEATENDLAKAQWVYVSRDVLPAATQAYFLAGRDLNRKLHIPVGIIVSAPGPACSPAQACSFPAASASR